MLKRFLRNNTGNIATIFALAAIPLMGATGAAVDFSRAYQMRTIAQDSLDSAALAANKLIGLKTKAGVEAEAKAFFEANTAERLPTVLPLTTTINGGELELKTRDADSYLQGAVAFRDGAAIPS